MTQDDAKKLLDKIVGQIFGYQNPLSIDQFVKKYAFDVQLPQRVNDSVTGEETWAISVNPSKFMTMENARKGINNGDWMLPKAPLNSLQDVLAAWNKVNYTATDRRIDVINVGESDNVYNSENVFRSMDIHYSKNVLFSNTVRKCEGIAAVQRSSTVTNSIRVDDCDGVDQSFSVSWSAKVTKSLFAHDCYDVYETIFCSHLSSKQYCIANMQYTEEEYYKIKELVIKWILTP